MATIIHAHVTFQVPDETLREGEETFEKEMEENLEFWFDIEVDAAVDVVSEGGADDAEPAVRADVALEFTIPDEVLRDVGDEEVEDVIRNDLESFFSVPITSTIERVEETG